MPTALGLRNYVGYWKSDRAGLRLKLFRRLNRDSPDIIA